MKTYNRSSVSRTLWLKREMDDELKKLVERGYFFSVSEAMRTGVFIVVLLSKLNPEIVKVLRDLAEEMRKLNKHLESKQLNSFHQLWRNVISI